MAVGGGASDRRRSLQRVEELGALRAVSFEEQRPVVRQCSQMSPEFTGGHLKL
jgi:hypothetical protein